MLVRTLFLSLILAVCFSVVIDTGIKQAAGPGPSFDPKKYQGKWYEIVRSRNLFFEGKAATIQYQYNDKNQSMKIRKSMNYFGRRITLKATATWHHDVPSIWSVKPEYWILNRICFNYTILDTDYDNYSVVYSLNKVFDRWIIDMVWIISRTPELSHDLLAHAITVVETNTRFKRDDLVPVR